MTIDVKEKRFEGEVESILLKGGYIKRSPKDFDPKLVMDTSLFIQFVKNSQQESWKKMEDMFGPDAESELLRGVRNEIENKSMIFVLRNGLKVSDVHIDCAYFKPVSGRNPQLLEQYTKNQLSIIRQGKYSNDNSKTIDIILCLNGFPISTAELKNPVTGQTFENAIMQYRYDRDPKEKLLSFKIGALAHFAIDPNEVHVTTRLNGDKTIFLPFNKGRDEGRGNPNNPKSYRTSYIWEEIWQKDIWLEIIGNFIELEVIEHEYPIPPSENLIFPRYHQLDAVLKLVEATKRSGPGSNYLIQHSTGSGKSNTIAWLSYKLFCLHDNQDLPIFDGIIVLSDRVGIVNQLGNTIKQFEQTLGVVEVVDKSSDLAKGLETQRRIWISTQQKFPYVLDRLTNVKGKNFAIIIDEAHSSQSGESALTVKQVLTKNLEEAAKIEARIENDQQDLVDRIEEEMKMRGPHQNLSYYAFTATPKKKTLRLFGTKANQQDYDPFHKYSMKQAIEEGFILDVLKNYTTYEHYFRLIQTVAEDKVLEGNKAKRALMKYVDTHHLNLSYKAQIIVEHFKTHCQMKIGGLAKAMVIASSRMQALKYKQEIDNYLNSKGYSEIRTLVAFSGSLKDEFGNVHTENSVNNISTEWELRKSFDTPKYNILIVADKYQTGFDQPLLHTMYVDKKLSGIRVVQTLSRLNRTRVGKTDTFVIDFQNEVNDIIEGYKPYYKGTTLVDKSDHLVIFRLYDQIIDHNIITYEDLNKFAEVFFKSPIAQTTTDLGSLYSLMDPIADRFNELEETEQDNFKHQILKYIEYYAFLSQVFQFKDIKLEKLFALCKFIVSQNLFKGMILEIPELKGDVSLQWYRLEKTHEGNIAIGERETPLVSKDDLGVPKSPDVLIALSEIVHLFNERFGDIRITDADRIMMEEWLRTLQGNTDLREIAKTNEFEDFYRNYETRLQELILHSLAENKYFVSRILADPDLRQKIMIKAAESYHVWAKTNNLPPISPNTPHENRLHFRETIRSCKGYLYWIDLYVGKEGLEFLIDSFNEQRVKQIRILSSIYHNESQINESLRVTFEKLQSELAKKGISLEMKLVSTKNAYENLPHDRFLLSENVKYNIPSFTTLVKGRFSEIKKTDNDVPFDQYWNDKDVLEITKDWNKIKNMIPITAQIHQAICSTCGKKITVPFRPDGIRPVYCMECHSRLRNTTK